VQEERAKERGRRRKEEGVAWLLEHVKKAELPESLITREQDRMFADSKERMSRGQGMWESYLAHTNQTEEEIRTSMREQAEKNVRLGVALGKVAEAEGIAESEQSGSETVARLLEIALKNVK